MAAAADPKGEGPACLLGFFYGQAADSGNPAGYHLGIFFGSNGRQKNGIPQKIQLQALIAVFLHTLFNHVEHVVPYTLLTVVKGVAVV